ncbi:MAG: hypothetical protein ACI9G1_000696, partial [Pirellulaceae bacterium]
KLLSLGGKFELYDLVADKTESTNLIDEQPEIAQRLKVAYLAWNETVEASVVGKDYPQGKVDPNQPARRFWRDDEAYAPYLKELLSGQQENENPANKKPAVDKKKRNRSARKTKTAKK